MKDTPIALQRFDLRTVLEHTDADILAALKNAEGIGPK